VATAIILLVSLAYWLSNDYNLLAKAEIDQLAVSDLDHIAAGIISLVKIQNESIQQQVDHNLNVAEYVLARNGKISFADKTVSWKAINQFTQEITALSLPQFMVGGQWMGQNIDTKTTTPVVDEVQSMIGGAVTIFQRMNSQGDMLRVATNVVAKDGNRAIGTYIPAANADGTQNAVVSSVLKKQVYHGRAFVVDSWYITAYKPLLNSQGEVIGMLFVGIKQENIASLRQEIINTKVGDTGYVYVLGAQGTQKGQYIISKNGERDGENILNSQDADGRYFIKSIIDKALTLKPGEVASESYAWKNSGEPAPREKIVRIVYYQPWDWVIGVGVYKDELQKYESIIESGRARMVTVMTFSGLALVLLVIFISIMAARSIVAPINHLAKIANEIAGGHVDQQIAYIQDDEVGKLAESFRGLVGYLRDMVAVANRLADGDLTVNLVPRSSRDALGDALLHMLVSLREVISKVAESANSVNEAAAHLAMASELTGDAAGQIASTVQHVAQGIDEQTQGVKKTSSAVEQMSWAIEGVANGAHEQTRAIGKASEVAARISTAIKQVTNNAEMVTRDSSEAARHSRDGASAVNEMIIGMEAIRGKVALSASRVSEMGTRSEEVGAIVETIEDIASQTNLLALNAAIEAARAGEQGNGFAVVADEVRKLAERSSLATKEIAGLIKGIQKTVHDAVSAMNESAGEVEAGVNRANSAGQALGEILSSTESVDKQADLAGQAAARVSQAAAELVEAVDAVSAVIDANTRASEKMTGNSSELTQAIGHIANVSKENGESVEKVSVSMKKVSAEVVDVSASAAALKGMAQDLHQMVSRFKLNFPRN
jgi:methyl-accepting chemotaxis protein